MCWLIYVTSHWWLDEWTSSWATASDALTLNRIFKPPELLTSANLYHFKLNTQDEDRFGNQHVRTSGLQLQTWTSSVVPSVTSNPPSIYLPVFTVLDLPNACKQWINSHSFGQAMRDSIQNIKACLTRSSNYSLANANLVINVLHLYFTHVEVKKFPYYVLNIVQGCI